MTHKPDPPVVEERHRRMARDYRFGKGYAEDRLRLWFEHGFTGPLTKFECETLPIEAQLIATVERDARAAALEEAARLAMSRAAVEWRSGVESNYTHDRMREVAEAILTLLPKPTSDSTSSEEDA